MQRCRLQGKEKGKSPPALRRHNGFKSNWGSPSRRFSRGSPARGRGVQAPDLNPARCTQAAAADSTDAGSVQGPLYAVLLPAFPSPSASPLPLRWGRSGPSRPPGAARGPVPVRPQLGEPAAPGRSAGTRAGPGSLRRVPMPHRPHENPGSRQPSRDGGDQAATPRTLDRGVRRHPTTNCHSQNASGCVASASVLQDFPFPPKSPGNLGLSVPLPRR